MSEMPEDGFSHESCAEIIQLAAERRMAPSDLFWFIKSIIRREANSQHKTFHGAQCPSYPNCKGGCGLGCTHEIETA